MTPGAFVLLLTAVLLPLVVNECRDWFPWFAKRLVRWAARRLGDPQACTRYEEEWVANIDAVPGKLSPLVSAFGYVLVLPKMRRTIRRGPHPFRTFWERLSEQDRAALARVGSRHQFPQGSVLSHQGDVSRQLFVVLSGQVRIVTHSAHEGEILWALRGPGDILGEIAALNGTSRSASMQADAHVNVLSVDNTQFSIVCVDFPNIAESLRQVAAQRQHCCDQRAPIAAPPTADS